MRCMLVRLVSFNKNPLNSLGIRCHRRRSEIDPDKRACISRRRSGRIVTRKLAPSGVRGSLAGLRARSRLADGHGTDRGRSAEDSQTAIVTSKMANPAILLGSSGLWSAGSVPGNGELRDSRCFEARGASWVRGGRGYAAAAPAGVMAPGKPARLFWLLDIGPSFLRAIGRGDSCPMPLTFP